MTIIGFFVFFIKKILPLIVGLAIVGGSIYLAYSLIMRL